MLFISVNAIGCDLPCIQNAYENILTTSDELNLPEQHRLYFGLRAKLQLNRLMSYMGIVKVHSLAIRDVTFELSKDQHQLRVIGFSDASRMSEDFGAQNTNNCQIEHVYSILEQGYLSISIGIAMTMENDAGPGLTLGSGLETAHVLKLPAFIKAIAEWEIFHIGVTGGTMIQMKDNIGLLQKNDGFQPPEFKFFSGDLAHDRIRGSKVRFVFQVYLPTEVSTPDLSTIFKCHELPPGAAEVCSQILKLRSLKIYDLNDHKKKPYIVVGSQLGYGDDRIALFVNTAIKGSKLTVAVKDIPLGASLLVREVNVFVSWGLLWPQSFHFGWTGEAHLIFFDKLLKMRAAVTYSAFGIPSLTLSSEGMNRLLWVFPIWIGNIEANLKLLHGTIPIGGAIGCEIYIGWDPSGGMDTRLKGMGRIKVDPLSVTNNFIVAEFSPVTIQTLLNMIVGHSNWVLPKMIGENGLRGLEKHHGGLDKSDQNIISPVEIPENPEHFVAIFAPTQVQPTFTVGMDSFVVIQPGLTIIGQIEIFGVGAKVYIRSDLLKLVVNFDFRLDPVILGNGLVKLVAPDILHGRRKVEKSIQGPSIYLGFQLLN